MVFYIVLLSFSHFTYMLCYIYSFNEFYETFGILNLLNPIALRTVKTLWSFGHSECNRVKDLIFLHNYTFKRKILRTLERLKQLLLCS